MRDKTNKGIENMKRMIIRVETGHEDLIDYLKEHAYFVEHPKEPMIYILDPDPEVEDILEEMASFGFIEIWDEEKKKWRSGEED